jgi:leader peptidase (prepilin peptidase) / N-methyltransferase
MSFCLIFALFGLLTGSFLNVCIVRLPMGESVVRPRSHCRQCQRPIASWDNIPVLSWVLLRARCRACGARISWRYPLIEIATSLLFFACCATFGLNGTAAFWSIFCFFLLGLAVMDAETLLLPDWFTLFGLGTGLLFSFLEPALTHGHWNTTASLRSVAIAALHAAVAAAFLLLIAGIYWLVRRRMGMGLGDVKLLAMLAAWLGIPQTAMVLFLAVVAGALYGVILILLARRREVKDSTPAALLPVPFGTMLSAAGLYSVFLGQRTLDWYLQFFH